jgi:hypothetical protein
MIQPLRGLLAAHRSRLVALPTGFGVERVSGRKEAQAARNPPPGLVGIGDVDEGKQRRFRV